MRDPRDIRRRARKIRRATRPKPTGKYYVQIGIVILIISAIIGFAVYMNFS